ncbi:hypothetical protein Aau02nite_69830 [Amorphoplanes auranticolor]|uniref:Uncharacterized protein n=1 Tax=Actinoplanes auranticolor TaxID=47988 RepID=A0A919SRE7_9ACTN|nr:hypothetical protein Aau02nite_69830 [Actinoplanes auranticolor]
MSEPMYPGTTAPRSRPTVVTVSSYLLYFTAAASIISAVLSLTTIGTIQRVYSDLYADTAGAGTESVIVAASVIGVVINILFAAGLAILAIYNNRGKQGARITTWVVGGIFLCCNGFGLLGNAATSGMNLDTGNTSGPSASEVEARLSDEMPGWFDPITMLLTVLVVLALLGAVILLALPAANAYFRKPQATWDPLNPYPGYPGQPAAYPGYPSQSPYPTYPGQPGQGYPGQPGQPGQPYPGQAYPGQPGQPPYPGTGGQPPYPQSSPPGGASDTTPPPATDGGAVSARDTTGGDPHTGSVPPTDPWSPPSPPPSSPPSDDKPGRSPTDPA